ncbi:rubrerythrin-like domain-containing protein [Natronoarchaeum sp. GCM10025703]
MVRTDPYTPTESYYECTECLARTDEDVNGRCPECGGVVRNIAVARE